MHDTNGSGGFWKSTHQVVAMSLLLYPQLWRAPRPILILDTAHVGSSILLPFPKSDHLLENSILPIHPATSRVSRYLPPQLLLQAFERL